MYVLIEFALSIMAVLVSVLIIFAHERMLYMDAMPPFWIFRLFSKHKNQIPLAEMEYDDLRSSPVDLAQELRFCIEKVRKHLEDLDSKDKNELIWQRFFSCADIICGSCFFFVNCIITFYMFIEYF